MHVQPGSIACISRGAFFLLKNGLTTSSNLCRIIKSTHAQPEEEALLRSSLLLLPLQFVLQAFWQSSSGTTTVGWSFRLLPFKSQQNGAAGTCQDTMDGGLQISGESFLFEVLVAALLDKEGQVGLGATLSFQVNCSVSHSFQRLVYLATKRAANFRHKEKSLRKNFPKAFFPF